MKKFLYVFLILVVMFLSGCSSTTDDTGNVKDPTDLIDPVDPADLEEAINGATSLVVGVLYNGEFNEEGQAFFLQHY